MYFKLKNKINSLLIVTTMLMTVFTAIPVYAEDTVELVLKDVTDSNPTTLTGEAKIEVSVKGNISNVTAMQAALDFSGNLKYKSVDYLVDADAPAEVDPYTANAIKKVSVGFALNDAVSFTNETPVFILTFEGEKGDNVTVTVDNEHSFCYANGTTLYSTGEKSATITAAQNAKEPLASTVKIVMDKVPGFITSNSSGVTLKITDQSNGNVIKTPLNSENRDSSSKAEFTVTNTVIKGNKYTVELYGIGYVAYKKTDVTFDDVLKITNSEFIPGDIDKDGKVTAEDKQAYEELIKNNSYNAAADFNRDTYVDEDDNVFAEIDSGNSDGENGDEGTPDGTGTGGTGGAGGAGGAGAPVEDKKDEDEIPTEKPDVTPVTPTTEVFTDIANYSWAKDSIYTLKDKGIISGISETEFAPANNIKRGDFILILTRMLKITNSFNENFEDVQSTSYYYNAIGSAKAFGIATGDGKNFMPEATITRQDLITLAYRAFLKLGYIDETDDLTVLDDFADNDKISSYAKSAMASMVKSGIIKGSDGKVNPLGKATRAEVAVMCARLEALID